jgi:superkiller protein 3
MNTHSNLLARLCLVTLATVVGGSALAEEQASPAEDYFRLGNEYYNAKLYDNAVEQYERCVELKPDYKEAWYNLGIAYSKLKKFKAETGAYRKAVELDPRYAKALYNLAVAYEDANQLEDALEAYKRVVEVTPDATDALVNLGILHARLGNLQASVAAYTKAIELNAEMADAHFNLGVAYGRLAEKAKDAAEQRGYLDQEKKAYEAAVAKDPEYHKGWYNLAIAHHKLGQLGDKPDRLNDEIAAYEKALKIRPSYPQALYNLAYAYEEKGQTKLAIASWQRYVESAEKLPTEQEYVSTAREELKRLGAVGAP